MNNQEGVRREIGECLAGLETIDCHSHTRLKKEYYARKLDLFSLTSYYAREMDGILGNRSVPGPADDEARWQLLKSTLDQARNVSYWRHNLVVYRELFGLEDEELSDLNWRAVNEAIKERTAEPGWYEHVLKYKCRIRTQVKNIPWFEDWDPEYFTGVLRMELALTSYEPANRAALEKFLGVSISGLAGLKQALGALVERYRARGIVGIKLAHAYHRTLHSVPAADSGAARTFAALLRGKPCAPEKVKELQDNIIYFLAGLAQDGDLVFQIHTGVQGSWGNVPDSNPELLLPLISAFRTVRFDLFHAGYPYSRSLGMMAKHFHNIWLNMAWMYVVSMGASRNILSEWLDLVPGYRLLGFGSDVEFPEFVYGHLVLARSCVADVLAEKVERDFLSRKAALALASRLFLDNGVSFYRLEGA